jgi:hypothetical protein
LIELDFVFPKPMPQLPAQSFYRSILAGMFAMVIFSLLLLINKEVQIDVDILGIGDPGHTEIFFSFNHSSYHPRNSRRWLAPDGSWLQASWVHRGVEGLTRIRIDPRTTPGEFRIGTVRLSGPRGDILLQGVELVHQMREMHQIEVIEAQQSLVIFNASGDDPHFTLKIPSNLGWPESPWLFSRIGSSFILAATLWLLLEWMGGILRRRAPGVHQRLRDSRAGIGIAVVLVCAALSHQASLQITDRQSVGDAIQNLRAAHNIYLHNTFSHLGGDDPVPTNFREPLPPFVTGIYLKLASLGGGLWSFEQLRSSEKSRFVKLSNLIWVFLGLVATWLLAHRLMESHWAALAVTGVVFWFTFHTAPFVDTLYTELPAATLLLWTSYALLAAVQKNSWPGFLLAGLLLGMLALTKAAFLYVGAVAIPLIGVLLALSARGNRRAMLSEGLLPSVVMLVGLAATVSPWIVRNHLLLGDTEIAQRASVIYGRAVMNQMSAEEIKGVFYLYGPYLYQRAVAGTSLADRGDDFERYGRWQRLNRGASSFALSDREAQYAGRPENAVSFHRIIAAEGIAFRRQAELSGHPDPVDATEDHFREQGVRMILEQPGRHLLMSAPFFWKGFWSFPDVRTPFAPVHWQQEITELLNLISGLALFGLFLVGILRLRLDWVAITLLPVGMLLLHALFTHNIPRYSLPAHPLMLVALATSALVGLRLIGHRIRRRTHFPSSHQ